jgi:hypothetical protein
VEHIRVGWRGNWGHPDSLPEAGNISALGIPRVAAVQLVEDSHFPINSAISPVTIKVG